MTRQTQKLSTVVFAMLLSSSAALAQRGYVRSDGYNAVVYVGTGGRVFELLLADTWQLGDLSQYAGAPPAFGGTAAPYVRSDGYNAVVYRGQNEHVYELFLAGDGWQVGDLTYYAGAPTAWSAPIPYVRSDGYNSVVYQGHDRHIYELFLAGDGWRVGDLSYYAGAPPALSEPAPYVRSDGVNAVVYVGLDRHIYELFLASDGWRVGDLTAIAGAPPAANTSGLAAYVRSDGVNSVVFSSVRGSFAIYELFLAPGRNWEVGDLTAITGAPLAQAYALAAYVRSDGFNSVVYMGPNRHIYELFLSQRTGWGFRDLSALSGAPAASDPPQSAYVRSDGFNSIVYTGPNFHIIEIFLVPGGAQWGDLTYYAGG